MIRPKTFVPIWLAILVMGNARSPLLAEEPPSSESQAAAKRIVAAWYDAFTSARDITCHINTKVEMAQDGAIAKTDETSYDLTLQRPNRMALRTVKGTNLSVVADGKQAYAYAESLNKYQLTATAPATLAELGEAKVLRLVNFRMGLGFFGDALKSTSFASFWQTYKSPEYVGPGEKNGVRAHHVRLTRDAMPFDLWFSADPPRLLSAAPDLKVGLSGTPQSLPPGVTYSISTDFKNWSYDAPPPADAFAIVTPGGVDRVNDLLVPSLHKLLGQPAPAFATTDLAGQPVKLADLSGKVILLDFWATWCGPCIRALPKVNATASKFKDRGVVFYAVNQQEEATTIKEFLNARELNVPVALDLDGAINQAYGVEGIPQLVIIDKNGKMQAIHIGAGPDVGDDIAKDLEAVLAGKDLAVAKLNKN